MLADLQGGSERAAAGEIRQAAPRTRRALPPEMLRSVNRLSKSKSLRNLFPSAAAKPPKETKHSYFVSFFFSRKKTRGAAPYKIRCFVSFGVFSWRLLSASPLVSFLLVSLFELRCASGARPLQERRRHSAAASSCRPRWVAVAPVLADEPPKRLNSSGIYYRRSPPKRLKALARRQPHQPPQTLLCSSQL